VNLVEIRCPTGALDAEDRARLAADITAGLVGDAVEDEVPAETLGRARAMTHLGFRELDGWTTGDGPWRPDTPPPLWLTMTVPETWRDEISRHLTGWLRRAVRRLDARHGWERPIGGLWINITGVHDGSIGLDGKASTADDVVAVMSEEFRARYDAGEVDLPDGVVIDPMCGMRVTLGPRAVTLEHDGTTWGFCAQSCRDAYARREGVPVDGG
jgi:YHS domain-containing protein/phenylpyruvate tautomerase PptA (4-oxalocrotonate tautomerase family)